MTRVVDVVVFSSTAGCSDPDADEAAIRRLSARSGQEFRWQPDGRGSAEGGHHRFPVVEEAFLVVEVDAHPELSGAGVDGGLDLRYAVVHGAGDREAVRGVVEQFELLDKIAVRTVRLRALFRTVRSSARYAPWP